MNLKFHGIDTGKHFVEILEEDGTPTGKTFEATDRDIEALKSDEARVVPVGEDLKHWQTLGTHKGTHKISYDAVAEDAAPDEPEAEKESV